MDADGHIIPIVDDDQGEGFKDEVDSDFLSRLEKLSGELKELEREKRKANEQPSWRNSFKK